MLQMSTSYSARGSHPGSAKQALIHHAMRAVSSNADALIFIANYSIYTGARGRFLHLKHALARSQRSTETLEAHLRRLLAFMPMASRFLAKRSFLRSSIFSMALRLL
jgi:hypothetical protein